MERVQDQKKDHNHKRYYEIPPEVEKKSTAELKDDLDEETEIIDEVLEENQEQFPSIDRRKLGLELILLSAHVESAASEHRIAS